jgi:hypothetical protein
MGSRTGLDNMGKTKFLTLTTLELQPIIYPDMPSKVKLFLQTEEPLLNNEITDPELHFQYLSFCLFIYNSLFTMQETFSLLPLDYKPKQCPYRFTVLRFKENEMWMHH